MEFRRTNSTLQSAAGGTPGSARAAPSPTGASTPTAKTMSKASLLPGGAHGTAPCTPPPMSGKRRNSSVNSSAVPLERSNSTAGRAFQRTNSTMGRQKGETIRQNNRVNVYVRVRAFAEKERTGKAAELAVQMKDDTVDVTVPEKGQFSFTFDGCFWSNDRESPNHRRPANQEDVFDEIGRPLVENVLSGYNAAVMAYGQTGSGKTYTTYGPAGSLGSQDEGLVPRVCNMIFARAANSAQKGVHYTVKASMLEVYLDDVFDLLNHRKQLTVRNDFKNHTFAVVGSKNVTVTSYKDVLELLTKAEPLRTFAETKIHDHSSRAHTLFTLEVHTEYDEPEMKPRCARILIADLAGSERIRLAGTEDGLGFEQARNINLSLLALGSCIEAVAQRGAKANVSIPEFRNSTLTKLLKDFLGGNSVSVMMVTIAPSAKDSNLSVQTLRFADRAKQITTHAKMNVIQEEEVVEGSVDYKRREDYAVKKEALYAEFQLEQTIEQLLNRIVDLEVKRNTCTDPDMQQHLDAELAEVEKALADAEYQLTCQRQILYGPVLQLEDAVCELQTTIQKQRADHEEELERLQSEQEQRLLEMKASHKAKQTQVEAAAAEERERQRQRLAAAKDEVEGLKSLIAQLQNENRLLQKKYEDLANSSAAKERELNDNLAALRRLLDETTAVKNEETEQLTRQVQEHQQTIEATTKKLAETEALYEETIAKLFETEDTLHSTRNQLTETENTLEATTTKLADTEAVLEETSVKLSESEAAREETAAKLADTEATLEETSAKLSESEAAREETSAKLADTEAALEETSAKLSQAESAIQEAHARQIDSEANVEDLISKLAETEAVLEETATKLADTEAALEETSAKLSESEAAREETAAKLADTEAVLEETSVKLSESEAAREETAAKLADTEAALEETSAKLSESEAAREETAAKLADTEAALEETSAKLSESEAAREETAAKLADTEAALEETSSKLSESEAAREETAAKLADTEAALEETSAKLSESEAAREETSAKLADTEAALEETSAKLSESEAAREETAAKLADTEAALEETSAKLADAEGELGDVSSKLAEMEAAVEELSTKLAETEGALEESNEKLNESEAAREETLARLADTEAALEETAAKLAESEVEVAEVTAKLAEMEAAAEELSSRLAETEAAYDELGGKHSELEALQAETAARCGEAEVAAEEAMTRLAETEAALDESNAKLSETEALYEETAGRLADTEAALEETSQRLSSEIEQLELALSDSRLEVEQHTLLNEKMAAQFEDSMETVLEGLTAVHYEGLTGFSNETVAYMQRLQESLGMSEAEMKENLARFNLLRSVLCKIDQEVKVATDGVQNPSSMGLRNCAPNVERTALKE